MVPLESTETPKVSWTGRPIGARPSRRMYLYVCLFAMALVALPFWFWYDTWFGRVLPDATIAEYLINKDKPRRAQQALVQIGERMSKGDPTIRQFYPNVVELAAAPNSELRQTAAWIMGQDKGYEPFHEALRKQLADPVPLVRRNAALGLAAFRDSAGIEEIRTMLKPSQVLATKSGKLTYRLKEGDYVNPGTMVARIDEEELRAQLPGALTTKLLSDGATVKQGQPIAGLAADDAHATEAIRALYLIGTPADADLIRPFLRHADPRVSQQAQNTLAVLSK